MVSGTSGLNQDLLNAEKDKTKEELLYIGAAP